MSEKRIILPEHILEKIEKQGRARYPEECCGILIGRTEGNLREVVRIFETPNVHEDDRNRRFMISPRDFREAEKDAGKHNLQIIGFYHSHPDHPAVPSKHDREFAWPWYIYLIVSVENGKSSNVQGWILRDDRSQFDPVSLVTS